jgi:hypothetical protein
MFLRNVGNHLQDYAASTQKITIDMFTPRKPQISGISKFLLTGGFLYIADVEMKKPLVLAVYY